jgi:hypothetical protein
MIAVATFAMLFVLWLAMLHLVHRLCLHFHYGAQGFYLLAMGAGVVVLVVVRCLAGQDGYAAARAYWPVTLGLAVAAVWVYDAIQVRWFRGE